MLYPHWDYFLSLESDLINLSRYIEFAENNYDTFSIELVRILLASSSEVEVVAKILCKKIDPEFETRLKSKDNRQKRYPNMGDYKDTILSARSILPLVRFETVVPRYEITLHPWISWTETDTRLDWWDAYNAVKHGRDNNYDQANLRNALNSVAGLFGLTLILYTSANQARELHPEPKLFTSSWYKPQNFTHEDLQKGLQKAKSLSNMGGFPEL
jgi:hypothetical protein